MRGLLRNEKVRLTAIRDEDIKTLEVWFNDVEFLRHYDVIPAVPQSGTDVKTMIDGFNNTSERYIFAIRTIASDEIVGIAGFDEILWNHNVATIFIGLGSQAQGQGFGTAALELLLDYGFNELNLYRIQLNVISYNKKAIKLYEAAGFKSEGALKEFILRDGNRYDLLLYAKFNNK